MALCSAVTGGGDVSVETVLPHTVVRPVVAIEPVVDGGATAGELRVARTRPSRVPASRPMSYVVVLVHWTTIVDVWSTLA